MSAAASCCQQGCGSIVADGDSLTVASAHIWSWYVHDVITFLQDIYHPCSIELAT